MTVELARVLLRSYELDRTRVAKAFTAQVETAGGRIGGNEKMSRPWPLLEKVRAPLTG